MDLERLPFWSCHRQAGEPEGGSLLYTLLKPKRHKGFSFPSSHHRTRLKFTISSLDVSSETSFFLPLKNLLPFSFLLQRSSKSLTIISKLLSEGPRKNGIGKFLKRKKSSWDNSM